MKATRIERDSMGELQVPKSALYGAQTQRAVENFPVSGQSMPEAFIRALILTKQIAAKANVELNALPIAKGEAIQAVCLSLLASDDLMQHFPVDIFQTGSGTSSNMNANEVIANLATKHLNDTVNPNDDVNCGQSSNDVIPTAIHISAALKVRHTLLPALSHLVDTIEGRKTELSRFCKTGRTHLMDAMPVRMDQTLSGWSAQVQQQKDSLNAVLPSLQQLALGGTAVGTGVNADPAFATCFSSLLSAETDIPFSSAPNFFALMSSQDTAVTVSGITKSVAVTLIKIANDLRWMNSGPLAGLGEITLPALQPGSSIMPGKVNPVVPESVAMAGAQVIGNDAAITIGGQSGNFELNVMLPMIAANLLNSLTILSNSATILADKAIKGFSVNAENLTHALHRNPILVTALNPIIGYLKAADIAKAAYETHRPVIDVAAEMTELSREQLEVLLDPMRLTENK